ncbi:MAG: hypothetical protein KDB00_19800 [Planctomycetales bacterium]|nr:hypothetical protein [Planctomycetales bacterium]
MCDLHRNTLDTPTSPGAIPEQIRFAQQQLGPSDWVKLYNSGNFFDPASIPPIDYESIGELCRKYERIIIENHPRFGLRRHIDFRDTLSGRLEVAVGLETIQPGVLNRIGKQMTRDDFDRYAARLRRDGIDLRVFLIAGAPGLTIREATRWMRLSIRHAVYQGARHISLIPARVGHGWAGMGGQLTEFRLHDLVDLFAASIGDLSQDACLSVDLWNINREVLGDADRDLLDRFETAILRQDTTAL